MKLTINTIIKPIFKMKNSYFYKYNNDFIEISDVEIMDYILNILDGVEYLEMEALVQKIQEYFELEISDVNELIYDLLQIGFLTEFKEKDRYTTNELFFSLFNNPKKIELQKKIEDTEICVLGLGGSTLIIQQLAQIGIGKITGVDYDFLEETNLNRQVIFKEDDIGKLKTYALQKNLKEINSSIKYDFKNIFVDSKDKIANIISSADIVILALDEPIIDSSIWVFDECKKQKKKLISGGVWGDEVTYTFFDYSLPNQPCYTCLMEEELRKGDLIRNYIESIKGKHFADFNTTTIFVGSILAGIITSEIVKLITGYARPLESGTALSLNSSTWSISINKIEVTQYCDKCSGKCND